MADWPADRVERRKVSTLVPYARNARTHSEAQVAQIAASIREWGWTVPVLVDEEGTIIAGHGRILAAQSLGLDEVPVMVASGWTDAQRRAYALADNRLALNAGWDTELLKLELADLKAADFDMGLMGFSEDDLVEALAEKSDEKSEGLTDEDAVPDVPATPVTVLGDVWQLGRHRIVCGDATSVDDWAKLGVGDGFVMFTSPPYNAGDASGLRDKYRPGVPKTKKFYDQYGDDKSDKEYEQLLTDTVNSAFAFVDTVVMNVQPLAGAKRPLLRWMNKFATNLVDIITWDKGHAAPHIQPGIMASRYEWIVILSRKENATRVVPHSSWQGKYSNVYSAPPQRNNEFAAVHGATFPVHLPEWIIGDLMNRCRGVVDCFMGTGTTIIAAEKLGRDACGIEISPAYCDVIVKRWQDFTGQQATLEGDGRTFDEVSSERR